MQYRTREGRSKDSSSSVSMGRAPCCDKTNVKKGAWSPEEDAKLKSYIDQNGTGGNWIALPQKIGLKRCGKSCRLRWLNYLRPNIKHGGFSEEEDNLICRLYISIGSRWSIIAAQLPGRTDNDIKNYWNTRLKKKLLGKQQRKDHQPVRTKQEEKSRDLHAITPIGDADGSRSTYWPEPYTYHHIEDEQASIDKLLTRLGCQLNPLVIAQPEDMYSDAAADLIVAPTMHTDNSFVDSLQGPAGFPNELDEMFHCNQVKSEGLGFYGSGDEINEGIQWEWYTGDERELEGDEPSNQPPEES